MDIAEHTKKVKERLIMVGSNEAKITIDGENVIYSDGNNSFGIEIPKIIEPTTEEQIMEDNPTEEIIDPLVQE